MNINSFVGGSKEKKDFNKLDGDQIREVAGRQHWLEENAAFEYDAYVKKQNLSQWWKENLWGHLTFKLKD